MVINAFKSVDKRYALVQMEVSKPINPVVSNNVDFHSSNGYFSFRHSKVFVNERIQQIIRVNKQRRLWLVLNLMISVRVMLVFAKVHRVFMRQRLRIAVSSVSLFCFFVFIFSIRWKGPTVTLTTSLPSVTVPGGVTTLPTPPPCDNGGSLINNVCNCPSGFIGVKCEIKDSKNRSIIFEQKRKTPSQSI